MLILQANSTSVSVMANTVNDLPWMGCVYAIQVSQHCQHRYKCVMGVVISIKVFSVGLDGKSDPLEESYTAPHCESNIA